MAKSEIEQLTEQFLGGTVRPNAGNREDLLNDFVNQLQKQDTDVSEWNEPNWRCALLKFGFRDDDLNDAMENLAAWGVVDNFVWETPLEADTEAEVDEAMSDDGAVL